MDPIGIAITATKLANLSLGVSKSLTELQSKYKTADRTLDTTRTYCTSVHAAALKIESWIRSTSANNPARRQRNEALELALTAFFDLMKSLETEITALLGNDPTVKGLRFRKRIKYLWEEEYFKQYLLELQMQTTAVHFLLHAIQL